MPRFLPPGRSLKFYALVSWAITCALAIVACLIVFAGSAFVEQRGEIRRISNDLIDKSQTAARRVSAELLIGPRGSVDSATRILKEEMKLRDVILTSRVPKCIGLQSVNLKSDSEACFENRGEFGIAYRRVPFVQDTYFVAVTQSLPKLWAFFQLKNIIWSVIPIAIVLGFGLVVQRFLVKRYFLRPIQALVETSTGEQEPPEHWPKEIREISELLYQSFKSRDEAVFSQIARGVVHDLRTLIHTPLGAVDLVSEQGKDSQKRPSRLEHLYSVCSQQLPKMREIIDNTLDGSRSIDVRLAQASIQSTVNNSIQTLDGLAQQTATEIQVENDLPNDSIAHDRVQLERAITNLIKNGVEACQESSKSDPARKKLVSVSLRAKNSKVEISIEDSGPGLPVRAGKVFRTLKSTKTHGSGLGLVVSRKIIEAHGGELIPGASSRLGGAMFLVRLPVDHLNTETRGVLQ